MDDTAPGTTLGELLGVGAEVEFEGRHYRLKEMDFEQRAKFGTWVRTRAEAQVASLIGRFPEDYVRLRLQTVDSAAAAGVYDFGGPAAVQAMATLEGQAQALYLMLQGQQPPVDEIEARRLVERCLDAKARAELLRAADPKASRDRKATSGPGGTASGSARSPLRGKVGRPRKKKSPG